MIGSARQSSAPPQIPLPLHLLLLFLVVLASTQLLTVPPLPPTTLPHDAPLPVSAPLPADVAPVPYALPPELAGKPEVVERRTLGSATFDMGDGRFGLFQTMEPLHYQDANGAWQQIDPAFKAVEHGWVNTANTLETSLAQRGSLAKLSVGDAGLGWEPEALRVSGSGGEQALATPLPEATATPGVRSADGRVVRYTGSWSDPLLHDQWQNEPGHSEYTMRLAALPAVAGLAPAHLDLVVRLRLRPGTTLAVDGQPVTLPLETSAPLQFMAGDAVALTLQPPFAYEQEHKATGVGGSYLLSATPDPSVVSLRLRLPWAWLAAPERGFPVIIDPLFITRSPSDYKIARYPNATKQFEKYVSLGGDLGVGQFPDAVNDLLLRFDKPTLPAGTTIAEAHLLAQPGEAVFTLEDPLPVTLAATNLFALTVWPEANKEPQTKGTAVLNESGFKPVFSVNLRKNTNETLGLTAKWNVSVPYQNGDGLLLRLEQRFCNQNDKFEVFRGCLGLSFDRLSTWSDEDLSTVVGFSKPGSPFLYSREGSGIALLAFYQGPALLEGQIAPPPSSNPLILPTPGNTPLENNQYNADHVYRLNGAPALPNKWQAVAVRGFGGHWNLPYP